MTGIPSVTTPGGTDLFADMSSINFTEFEDDTMMLTEEMTNEVTNLTSSTNNADTLMTPRTAEFAAALEEACNATDSTTMLFEHELMSNPETPSQQQDVPTPLVFTLPSRSSSASPNTRFHSSPMNKHKRVRSNPDFLAGTSYTQLLQTTPSTSEDRQSISHHPSSSRPSLTLTPKFSPITTDTDSMMMNPFGDDAMPAPLPISIGTVDVVTPMGFHTPTDSIPLSGSQQDMNFVWSDSKRKRPQDQSQLSNWYPSNLMQEQFNSLPPQQGANNPMSLYTGFQESFHPTNVQMKTTNKPRHVRRSSMPHTRLGKQLGSMATSSTGLSMDLSHMDLGFLQGSDEQFQQHLNKEHHFPDVPFQQQINMPSIGFNSPVLQSSSTAQMPSPIRMNVGQFNLNDSAAKAVAKVLEDANRKSYKCGRCGQPKVGHVCTMPDLRNNWAQAELDITSGLRPASRSLNCLIVAVKGPWIPLHEDNM